MSSERGKTRVSQVGPSHSQVTSDRDGDGLSARSRGKLGGGGFGGLWSGRRCGDREARSRGSYGRGRGRVRPGQVRSRGRYGEGSRGRCGEGARRSPRARVRARRRCGEGRVEDTWRCSCTITGRCGKTIEVSVRQVLHTVDEKPRGKSVRFPPHAKSSHSPCAPDASCSMQHDA